MPRWVKWFLLGMGVLFVLVGVGVGVFGTRLAQAHVAKMERLQPLNAVGFDDQRVGAEVLVEGTISPRNPVVMRDVVAYVRERLEITTDADGDRRQTWRSDTRETPPLLIDADGIVMLNNESYSIDHAHETWYDEVTLDFNERPRDGSRRYYGLVAERPVTVYGTVAQGAEGNELSATTVFGGTHEQYMESLRQAAGVLPLLGVIFGVVGAIECVIALVFFWRR